MGDHDMDMLTHFWLLLAGLGGAILPVAISNGTATRSQALTQVTCGALMATFLAPALERHFLPNSPEESTAGVSFLIGCFGLKLTELTQRLLDKRGEALANRLIDRIAGSEGGKQP
jgi:hypothetical protein